MGRSLRLPRSNWSARLWSRAPPKSSPASSRGSDYAGQSCDEHRIQCYGTFQTAVSFLAQCTNTTAGELHIAIRLLDTLAKS